MEDFASILVRDYGLKPQGKSAPMSSTKVSPVVGSSSRGSGYGSGERKGLSGRMTGNASTFGQEDGPHLSRKNGNSRGSGRSPFGGGGGEDIFSAGNYDDVFGGPPKSSTSGPRYDDVFGDGPEPARGPVFDDLFGGLNESKGKTSPSGLSPRGSPRRSDRSHFASEPAVFDELLPGFSSEPVKSRSSGDAKISHEGDPFVPLMDDPLPSASSNSSSSAPFIDPLDVFTVPSVAPIKTTNGPRVSNNASAAFDGFDIFEGFSEQSSVDASKPRESSQSSRDDLRKSVEDFNHSNSNGSREQSPTEEIEPLEKDLPTVNTSEAYHISAKSSPFFSFKSDDGIETAAASVSSTKPGDDGQAGLFSSSLDSPVPYKTRSRSSPFAADVERWLTVNDIKLVTKPSSVPPPSRPPPLPGSGRYGSGSRPRVDSRVESVAQDDRSVSSSWPSANATSSEEEQTGGGTPGGSRKDFFGRADYKSNLANNAGDGEKDVDEDSVGVKDRERERQEKEDTRIAREKEKEKEIKEAEAREEKERERHRRYKEKEREREKDRAAVQRVTLEARERAAHEARERAQRSAVERATAEARERAAASARARSEREKAAVEKANAEARERAEQRAAVERVAQERAGQRAAVERAAAEARERAAQEARERAERAAAERAAQEARERAERAATDRVAQEARERAERAAAERAAAARERSQQQRKSENDLESFFGRASTPPSTVERQRPASMNNHNDLNEARRSTMNTSRPSTTASNDDWMSLINPTHSNDDSREHDGETPERRKARTGSQQRSSDRAARAVAEIKQRELNNQREQLEKQRAADQLDSEIKRWAAGKEGNLRALLSTLQYVLWPECGWAPVSLSDLITAAHVKKTYRKATLFVHPDKVQQKGATVQQKYIAEKVFDLLKEAWNKFNSEELF